MKRFCTLKSTLFMKTETASDHPNPIPATRPHLIFAASKFCTGEDWKEVCNQSGLAEKFCLPQLRDGVLERELWDAGVDVSFQENAWVDSETNAYGLKKMRPIHDALNERGIPVAVLFEDQLKVHDSPQSKEVCMRLCVVILELNTCLC